MANSSVFLEFSNSLSAKIVAALLIVAIIYIANKVRKYLRSVTQIEKIPGPKRGSYFFGNVDLIKEHERNGYDPGEALLKVISSAFDDGHKQLTRIWLGPYPYACCCGPESAEVILSSNKLIDKSFNYDFFASWLGQGLLNSNGDKWRSHRKMLTPSFHFKILDDFLPVMTRQTRIFVKVLNKAVEKNNGVISDISTPILNCALDTICETAMGVTVNAQDEPDNDYVKSVHAVGLQVMERLTNPWHLFDVIYALSAAGRDYKSRVTQLHAFTNKVLRGKKEEMVREIQSDEFASRKRMPFMDTLIYQHLKDANGLSEDEIREEVDTFMFEGHDTTGWGVTWATYLLGLHPDVQSKVRDELDSVFGDNDAFTMEDLRELKYLECVIKEAQRLFPSVPVFSRSATEEVDVCGFRVPEGATLVVAPYFVHRDPNHWPDPELFDPDRFAPDNSRGRHPFAFVPFSAGPRNCIGQKFAMLEEKSMLAALFRHFSVESLTSRDELRFTPAMILKSKNPIRVKLTPRN